MDVSKSREAELLRNYAPYIGRIVSECMKKWRINPCHRDDLMQEGRLAFLSNLRSDRIKEEGCELACGMQIFGALYIWAINMFPLSRIPKYKFKSEAKKYSFISFESLPDMPSSFVTDEIVMSGIQKERFLEELTLAQRNVVSCMENGLRPMEICRALSISKRQGEWIRGKIKRKAASFFGA